MGIEDTAIKGAEWLWDQLGKDLIGKLLGTSKKSWEKFKWRNAEEKYRARLYDQHRTTRLLGNPKPIDIKEIYTDVYVLDKLTASQRFEIEELQKRPFDRDDLTIDTKRQPALEAVLNNKHVYILGKPGAGKTTFLKYLTLQACRQAYRELIPSTPIFVSLKEWSDSKLELMPYLVYQFDVCAFPDANAFIEHLLKKGQALVLFDGLDEVSQEGKQRAGLIRTLTDFAKKYPENRICLTCRIAATDLSFEQPTHLEIADFTEEQMRLFASKWYESEPDKHARFRKEFDKPEHEGLRELARTPLLMALLCLAFDETLLFPTRRIDLYKEALGALLKKWDVSRGIERDRDAIYRKLSPVRKEQMLARLAAEHFEAGRYFIKEDTLIRQITAYLRKLPADDATDEPDGEAVLKAIEAQHGLLVKRAHLIYSFSHFTFQEYFTARYIVDNAAKGAVKELIHQHLTETRWSEVFQLTASLLDNADEFFSIFLNALSQLAQRDEKCVEVLRWAQEKSSLIPQPGPAARAICSYFILLHSLAHTPLIYVPFGPIHNHDPALALILALAHDPPDFTPSLTLIFGHAPVRKLILAQVLGIPLSEEEPLPVPMEMHHFRVLRSYLEANWLLLRCLRLAVVSDRTDIEARLLLPPEKSELELQEVALDRG
jgi:NACHT domain-containing protein